MSRHLLVTISRDVRDVEKANPYILTTRRRKLNFCRDVYCTYRCFTLGSRRADFTLHHGSRRERREEVVGLGS